MAMVGSILLGCKDENKIYLQKNQVIGCFGDSITAGNGSYVQVLQAEINKKQADLGLQFINLGKSSETVTGLTEKMHPGPRPYLFDRLDAVLDKNTIDVAMFCYGINCGIYGQPSARLFDSFKIGVYSFLEKVKQRNIKAILLTPPPLALNPIISDNVEGSAEFGYQNPYPDYDQEVLKEFSDIILQIRHVAVLGKIDIRTPLLKRKKEYYGEDPIHPNEKGHEKIAGSVIEKIAF